MLRSFWTWAPRTDDRWFYDKSVWQKMFRAMGGCGFDSMIFANARIAGADPAGEFAEMRRWILSSGPDYDITPYLAIGPDDLEAPDSLRGMLETFSEIRGVFVDADGQAELVQRVLVDALDAVRPDALLYIRTSEGPDGAATGIKRRGNRPIRYSVRYTGEHVVDENPDPAFSEWVEAVGAENVSAEFSISNFEPWTSFSYDTADGILANLGEQGCDGFSLCPLAPSEWPHTSDTFFKLQWQRDLVWYGVWGGTSVLQQSRQGQPKWLARNQKLVSGFAAGSRILELLSLYFAGDKSAAWRPQFCSIRDEHGSHLFSIEDMLHTADMPAFSARQWWEEVTGDAVVHLDDYITSGTTEDAYGPEELITELSDLSEQAIAAGEKGMRSASGEKELPSFARDAMCMGRLGEFYVERLRAALSHARGNDTEAVEHLTRALGFYREIAAVDSSHREGFDWKPVLDALEAEHADATRGVFGRGEEHRLVL